MELAVSVVLCTFNPDRNRMQRSIDALTAQSISETQWELIIVDNASDAPVSEASFSVPLNARFIRESRRGLVYARVAGIRNARAPIIIFCDDDNAFSRSYVAAAIDIMACHPRLGVAIGKSKPQFEVKPDPWMSEFFGCLAIYDHGDEIKIARGLSNGYPTFVGGGCGAVFRREALDIFLRQMDVADDVVTGRRGLELSSGEDNDIVLNLLTGEWEAGYFPQLELVHLIAARRLSVDYLGPLNEGIARSWVKVLDRHGLCPWRPISPSLVPLRMLRAYVRYRAWKGPAQYVRWRGACGQFRGRAEIKKAVGVAGSKRLDATHAGAPGELR
jgi:glycosyltransferase involved in cell wall biosynthesis